jgi:hypothetical protein
VKNQLRIKVRLVSIKGDQSEFQDLVGQDGELREFADGLYFRDLRMTRKRLVKGDKEVIVHTHLGNAFTFEKL